MPVTAKLLRDISDEAMPILRRQKDDAELIAGLRNILSAQGGDWSALKALLKAQVDDEADDGEGKRVRKILDKADSSTAYADMLGLAKMNEENFSASQSYAEAKGRGDKIGNSDPISHDPETVELTDNQESETFTELAETELLSPSAGTVEGLTNAVSPASDESETDDVGATASSTNSTSKPTKGERDAKSSLDSVSEALLIYGAGQVSGAAFAAAQETGNRTERQPPPDLQNAPAESAADTISAPIPHSPDDILPVEADTAGEANPSNASPAPPSEIDLTIPAFLRRTEGGYRKHDGASA